MDRLAPKVVAALIVVLFGVPSALAGPAQPKARRAAPDRKGTYRQLEEVKIVGSVERPEILFFLPRAKFRLLPMKSEADWREEVLRDDMEKADIPR